MDDFVYKCVKGLESAFVFPSGYMISTPLPGSIVNLGPGQGLVLLDADFFDGFDSDFVKA